MKEFKSSDREQVADHWAAEAKALAMMNTLHQDHIVRFFTAFCRGSPGALEYYLMFEWADGGNLHDLWDMIPKPDLTAPFVKWIIRQLRGLAQALSAAHNFKSAQGDSDVSYRHGDLKPANILWFRDDELGTLKIGDWGEAKSHETVTAMRRSNTTARYGTRRYEPPECQIGIGSAYSGQGGMRRSRLYDIWSFGCIALETIVWVMYGNTGLRNFDRSLKGSPFYEVIQTGQERSARVHHVVLSWINYISRDAACHPGLTALGDLLELVQDGLLVVELPGNCSGRNDPVPLAEDNSEIPMISVTLVEETEANDLEMHPGPSVQVRPRCRADELSDRLNSIEKNNEADTYWSAQRELPVPNIRFNQHLTSDSRVCYEGPTRSYILHDYAMPSIFTGDTNDDQMSATKMDLVFRDVIPHKQLNEITKDVQDDEVHFITKGRPKGSKIKRNAGATTAETKISTSGSSGQRRLDSKRRRVEGDGKDGGNDEDRDDQNESFRHKGSRDSQTNLNIACPFAKKNPLEYPQCRSAKFRDNAKVK